MKLQRKVSPPCTLDVLGTMMSSVSRRKLFPYCVKSRGNATLKESYILQIGLCICCSIKSPVPGLYLVLFTPHLHPNHFLDGYNLLVNDDVIHFQGLLSSSTLSSSMRSQIEAYEQNRFDIAALVSAGLLTLVNLLVY